jgi:hypothetical protein
VESTIRRTSLAIVIASILALTVAGLAAGRTTVADTASPTVTSFEDTNGNGTDDDCEENVLADPTAEASAETAADLDGDGTISVSEAARSDRTGGKNCNHGGYVSWVAHGACLPAETAPEPVTEPVTGPVVEPADATTTTATCAVEPTTVEAAQAGDAAAKAEKAAAKAAKKAEKAAAKAAKKAAHDAAKVAKKAARDAAKAAKKAAKSGS